jgi:transposase
MRTKHKNIKALKERAVALRLGGETYPEIEKQLGVNRSTLSGWLAKLVLPKSSVKMIAERKRLHLVDARLLAANAHRNARMREIKEQKEVVYKEYEHKKLDKASLELILASLYLGEGVKVGNVLGLANSNPKIVFSFVNLVRWLYSPDEEKFRCFLHLRMDQSDKKEKEYWSNSLSIPVEKFGKSQFDRRTLGKKTHLGYHGVCIVYYYDARLARRLAALQNCLLDKILTGA